MPNGAVSRDALIVRAALRARQHELPSGRFARFATGADIVSWICELVGARDDERAFAVAARRRLPTRSTALPFHRKRPAYEAPTKKMLKYCGDEVDPKSRTLLDYHPVEVARQMALATPRRLCARAAERADVARLDEGRDRRARARLPEHQAHHQTSSTASAAGWRRK